MTKLNELEKKVLANPLPKHIAIIMDGNGRWAKMRNQKRIIGHKAGVDALRKVVEIAGDINLEYLTVYAFSTENWGRSKTEVNYLLKLIMDSLNKEIEELRKNNVNIRFIGSEKELSAGYNKKVLETCKKSWDNDGLKFNIAMNYGSRREIFEAFLKMHSELENGKLSINEINEDTISNYFYTADMPDPELVIRTSGEQRLSNFLIWQSAYAEFWFTKTLWPDFSKEEFLQAIVDFQTRERRFGKR